MLSIPLKLSDRRGFVHKRSCLFLLAVGSIIRVIDLLIAVVELVALDRIPKRSSNGHNATNHTAGTQRLLKYNNRDDNHADLLDITGNVDDKR